MSCYESTDALVDENEAVQRLEVKIRDDLELNLQWEKKEWHSSYALIDQTRDMLCNELKKDTTALFKESP